MTTDFDLDFSEISPLQFPHFPANFPECWPLSEQQIVIAAKIESLLEWGTPPPMIDQLIALLDWYDGDTDAEDDGLQNEPDAVPPLWQFAPC